MAHTSNPLIQSLGSASPWGSSQAKASARGVLNKTLLGLLAVVAMAALTWHFAPLAVASLVSIVAGLVCMVAAVVVAARQKVGPGSLMVYCALEGIFVGGLTHVLENYYQGVASQALLATVLVALVTLAVYHFSGMRVGPKFRKYVAIGTLSLVVLYLVNLVLSLLHVHTGLVTTGPHAGVLSLVISTVAIVLATFNLVIDFDNVTSLVEQGLPASTEWRASLGLVATLVWLYVELLRLFTNLNRS